MYVYIYILVYGGMRIWLGSLVSWDQQWHRWYHDRNQARYGYDSVRFHHPESPYWGAIVNGTRTKQILGIVYCCYIYIFYQYGYTIYRKKQKKLQLWMESRWNIKSLHDLFTWHLPPEPIMTYTFFKLIVLKLIMTTSVSRCEQGSSSFMVIRVPRCDFKCAQAMHFYMSLSEKY